MKRRKVIKNYREEYDVVVVGGGTGGTPAAIAAARNGVDVLLIEKNGFLGGMTTGGITPVWPYWLARNSMEDFKEAYIEGVFAEIQNRLHELGALDTNGRHRDEEVLKFVLEEMCLQSGVQLLYHSFLFRVSKDGRKVLSIDVANKSGLRSLSGKVFVDGTGDGDLATLAGAEWQKGRESDGAMQPMSTVFKLAGVDTDRLSEHSPWHYEMFAELGGVSEMPDDIAEIQKGYLDAKAREEITDPRSSLQWVVRPERGIVEFNGTRVQHLDATKAEDLTQAEISGKRQAIEIWRFLKRFPAFANSYLIQMSTETGIRESRRIVGEYMLTEEDVLSGKKFEDGVARAGAPIDIHDPTEPMSGLSLVHLPDHTSYDIPYRCLVPKGVDNVLIGSRCISATHEAFSSVRLIPQVSALGQAAGTAAALACQKALSCKRLDVELLRHTLKEQGANIWQQGMPG